ESEIAQSECATDVHPFVRIWMHTAMVRYDGEKMSKSLGNMVFVRDALRQYDPDAIRLYLLNHHYRTPWEYEDDGPATFLPLVQQATDALALSPDDEGASLASTRALTDFDRALENDLDTPAAIAAFWSLVETIRGAGHTSSDASAALRGMAETLGLRLRA
ncbi:MAG TPA: class I tRNA ligase family protein, partial [Thermomicrobiales bacterium]